MIKLFPPPKSQSLPSPSELGDSYTPRTSANATVGADSLEFPSIFVEPVAAREEREHSQPSPSGFLSRGFHLMPVSSASVLLTLNQLALMSQNGVELTDAVGHVVDHCDDPRLAASLDAIREALSGGSPFSQAVAHHGHYFPDSLPAMLAAAEATGDVPETLAKVCDRMRGEMEVRGTIIGALIYPVILVIAAVVVMALLIFGVLPQFGRVFDSTGAPVPMSTGVLLSVGEWGQENWLYISSTLLAVVFLAVVLRRHPLVHGSVGKFLLHAPVIRDAFRPLMAGRNFRTIAAMVRGGVPLLQAVQLTRNTIRDPSWRNLLDRVEENLVDGLTASAAMSEVNFLPSEATQMMATGEKTGRVSEVLEDIGEFYEQEGSRRIRQLVVALEPMIILIMGVVVAGVVMSVMLPLLDVSAVQS